jgi:hypothetical protein
MANSPSEKIRRGMVFLWCFPKTVSVSKEEEKQLEFEKNIFQDDLQRISFQMLVAATSSRFCFTFFLFVKTVLSSFPSFVDDWLRSDQRLVWYSSHCPF